MDDLAYRSIDTKRVRIRDAVIDSDEFCGQRIAELDDVAVLAGSKLDALERYILILELKLDKLYGHCAAENVRLEFPQEIGERADVVFVSVCDENASELFLVASDVSEVRDDAVYAGHVLFGEAHAAVNDYHVATIFYRGHVLADLADTAQRYDLYGVRVLVFRIVVSVSFRIAAHYCSSIKCKYFSRSSRSI